MEKNDTPTMTLTSILATLVALTLVLGTAAAQESEKMLTLGEAPEAVQHTVRAVQNTLVEHRGDCKITQVKMKTQKDGTIMYEAYGIMADGKKVAIQVAGDGKFIKVESDDQRPQDKK